MENLETIIELLYKRVPVQQVVNGRITYGEFNQIEFIKMARSYVFHHSENESWNLLNYFLDTFQESAKKRGRRIERKLNVFEPLFYYAQEFLQIRDNEMVCRYSRLIEWRKMTTVLSEDLIVSAFLAAQLTYKEIKVRGFSWKTVISHNNAQLKAIIRRGISENHSHLNGAAPIFHISWLSLMNNVNASKLGKILRGYDEDRRYTNVAYANTYQEISFYERYMQAAVIRLLLYCKVSGKRLKIGEYNVAAASIQSFIKFKPFRVRGYADEFCLDCKASDKILNYLYGARYTAGNIVRDRSEKCYNVFMRKRRRSFREIVLCIIECSINDLDWGEVWKSNVVLEELLESSIGACLLENEQVVEVIKNNRNIPLSILFQKLFSLIARISLEDASILFLEERVFEIIWERKTLENVEELLKYPKEIIREKDYLQSMIDAFRLGDSRCFDNLKSLDYILSHLEHSGFDEEMDNYIFSGERWLMYIMLRKIYLDEEGYETYFNYFYIYLLIKEGIRSELIQSNINVGFRNFEKYQSRKGDLLTDKIYTKEFTRLAVSNSLVSKNIRKMELRIAPEDSSDKICRQIQKLDKLVLPNDSWKENIFYTVHFIKSLEKPLKDTGYIYCRHYQKRQDIEKRAYALTGLREKYPYVGERILGIDAAANEIGCRPEVFAPMFRYLKMHRHSYDTNRGMKKLPQLGATYHVGEDFLDLADGLRAIEEAILFLNLESGDRLGHALALGIDVREWYQGKRYRIALTVQDYLDNLVWIYHKLIQYDIRNFENFKEWILGEYSMFFGRLYKKNMLSGEVEAIFQEHRRKKKGVDFDVNSNGMDLGIYNYHYAWQLRGDDPKLYELGYFDEDYYIERQEEFRVNFHFLKDLIVRRIPEAALLYYMYHYNGKIREGGSKTIEVCVSMNYVNAVAAIQRALQKEIARKGIAIETNPSSNYLIGTFRQYDKHPIIQFYNKGLIHDPEQLKFCPQLSVSINTDDQGIFSTSLENEYALMACALESVVDDSGEPMYNKTDIYEWLDRIRIMGNEQSFGMKQEGNTGVEGEVIGCEDRDSVIRGGI